MATVPSTSGVGLTGPQLYSIAVNAGFSTAPNGSNPLALPDAVVATAIAMAENGSTIVTSNVLNDTASTGDYSIGPWQINLRVGAGNTVVGSRFGFTAAQLANPFNNAFAAKQLHDNLGGWGPSGGWSTFGGNSFWQYLPIAAGVAGVVSSTDQVANNIQDVANQLGGNASPASGSGGAVSTNPGFVPPPGIGNNANGVPTSGGGGGSSGGSSGGGSGGSSTPSLTDFTSGISVVIAAVVLIIVGALIWKGDSVVRVATNAGENVKGAYK